MESLRQTSLLPPATGNYIDSPYAIFIGLKEKVQLIILHTSRLDRLNRVKYLVPAFPESPGGAIWIRGWGRNGIMAISGHQNAGLS